VRRVLVTGAGGSAAANFVQSLRAAPEPFHVVGTDVRREHLELADLDARYLLPRADDAAYIDELNAVVEAEKVEVVHPQPDPEVWLLAGRGLEVWARTFLPSAETIALCQDKAACAARLEDADIPVPQTGHGDVHDAAAEILAKHGKAWVRATRGAGARASLPVTTVEQAVAWAQYWVETRGLVYEDFMVGEFLPGREFAFQSIWRRGELVTSQGRERLEYLYGHLTPSGQTSTPSVAKTIQRDDVNEIAASAVRAVDPDANGVFCVDLKEDAEGTPRVTEINAGRFFTTSNFLTAAGANMPYLYVRLAYGEDVNGLPPFDAVEEGLYWVRMVDMGYKLVREGEWTARRLAG
jgi:glutathione synthase/RimK-type ligase-like ATP-grasp enzyme